jgi:hypothetical protein
VTTKAAINSRLKQLATSITEGVYACACDDKLIRQSNDQKSPTFPKEDFEGKSKKTEENQTRETI